EYMTHSKYVAIEILKSYEYFVILVLAIIVIITRKINYGIVLHRTFLYTLPYLVCVFLLTPLSLFIWKYVPGFKTIDFPWRVLGLMTFIFPLIMSTFSQIKRVKLIALFLAILSLVIAAPLVSTNKINYSPESFYSTNQGTTTSASEYSSIWMKSPLSRNPSSYLLIKNEPIKIDSHINKSRYKQYSFTLNENATITTSTMYFPGWSAYLNGKVQTIRYKDTNGVITLDLPQGRHNLELKLHPTLIRTVSESITLSTVIILIILFSIRKINGTKII
ncbi:MAG: hypothetical protein M3P33_03080, partial [bacterium]|nr:hypothetical protein [bacterium]